MTGLRRRREDCNKHNLDSRDGKINPRVRGVVSRIIKSTIKAIAFMVDFFNSIRRQKFTKT